MEIALSVLCAILAGLVLFMIQKNERRYDRLEDHIQKEFQRLTSAMQQFATEVAVLKALRDKDDHAS